MKRVRCEIYSRVVGFLRPVNYWNPGKKQEFKDRTDYLVPALTLKEDEPKGVQE